MRGDCFVEMVWGRGQWAWGGTGTLKMEDASKISEVLEGGSYESEFGGKQTPPIRVAQRCPENIGCPEH